MRMLLKNCRIIGPKGAGKPTDILIANGRIEEIAANISAPAKETLTGEDLYVSAGWVDLGVQACDPGNEHREDFQTVRAAAAAGGYTGIALWPDTDPCVDSKSGISYIQEESDRHLVDLLPLGALSRGCKGKDITEMIDMRASGALAFTDALHPVSDSGLLLRALQYVRAFDGLIIHFPHDQTIGAHGQMHEGMVSTSLGLPGIPAISEELMVARDIQLLEYTGSKLHLSNISTAGSVNRIRAAKAAGLRITCSVPVWNLVFDDTALSDFNSLFKMMPPLRESEDREALIQGVLDGTIDHISANHVPLEEEHKSLEFPYASFGVNGLETTFSLLQTYLSERIPIELVATVLGDNVRRILGLDPVEIAVGQVANLTVLERSANWVLSPDKVKSRSRNNPLIGEPLRGKVRAVLRNDWYIINE
ncbi:MAG: dihydroorotase [Saprospiraceae bacterium]|nr:dihydroorotase [Saprospiraceae bacterium]